MRQVRAEPRRSRASKDCSQRRASRSFNRLLMGVNSPGTSEVGGEARGQPMQH